MGFLPTIPSDVSNRFHAAGSGGVVDHVEAIEPRSAAGVHVDWCWHLAGVLPFSRMGEHRHATSSCGLDRSPKRLSITSECHTDVLVAFLHCNSWRFWFSGLVVLLVAVWLDWMDLLQCLFEIRLPSVWGYGAFKSPTARFRQCRSVWKSGLRGQLICVRCTLCLYDI